MNKLAAGAVSFWKRQLELRFLMVGVWNTVFGYGCFSVLFLLVGERIHYLVLLSIAHFISVANAYYWHRRITFRSQSAWRGEFLRFNLSYLGVLAFGLVALPVLVKGMGLHPLVAGALVTLLAVLLSFVFHRGFSFRNAKL